MILVRQVVVHGPGLDLARFHSDDFGAVGSDHFGVTSLWTLVGRAGDQAESVLSGVVPFVVPSRFTGCADDGSVFVHYVWQTVDCLSPPGTQAVAPAVVSQGSRKSVLKSGGIWIQRVYRDPIQRVRVGWRLLADYARNRRCLMRVNRP